MRVVSKTMCRFGSCMMCMLSQGQPGLDAPCPLDESGLPIHGCGGQYKFGVQTDHTSVLNHYDPLEQPPQPLNGNVYRVGVPRELRSI